MEHPLVWDNPPNPKANHGPIPNAMEHAIVRATIYTIGFAVSNAVSHAINHGNPCRFIIVHGRRLSGGLRYLLPRYYPWGSPWVVHCHGAPHAAPHGELHGACYGIFRET